MYRNIAIEVMRDHGNFPSTKHVEIKHIYAREAQLEGNVKISKKIAGENNWNLVVYLMYSVEIVV